jgi:hypothetical protein
MTDLATRLSSLDWRRITTELDTQGWATTGPLLTPAECTALADGYDSPHGFRSRVVMARHGFGAGEYRYYADPLPEPVATLRAALYPHLAPIARRWEQALGRPGDCPDNHAAYLATCHAAGQTRPTPLLLRYGPGDYNCLHQDLYGDLTFPLQAAFLLNAPGTDFTGGQFVLTEQRPRMQSRADVVDLSQGEAVIFAVNHRPVQGTRGPYRVAMRHGVSRVRSGQRHTLGIIFHDSK